MAGKEFSMTDANKENVWDESKLKLIEYSLNTVRNDTMNIRKDKYMQKEVDDGGFGAAVDGFDDFNASASTEDIVGSGSEDEKFVIKGGLKTADGLTRIAKCINDANVDCNAASDNLESTNLFDWKKTKTGYDALGNAWDSTVNFLKHPWSSMQKESSIEEKMEPNDVVPDSVNLTINKTSSAWENTTQFVPVMTNNGKTIKNTLITEISF